MSSLAARVLRTIRRFELLPRATRVVVGVSGGSDSVALLHLLLELQPEADFRVAGLAHVNHGLRGGAADVDEAFCRELAAALSLPAEIERVDVHTRAAAEGRSLEDAARLVRYEALDRMARRLGADRIAVGHTVDDQAETVLLRLLRGAGTRGLAGVRPVNGGIVRPLLEVTRDDLRAWLSVRHIGFVEDETNADVRFRRNAVRHLIMPVLRQQFGEGVGEVLARHAAIASEDEAVLATLAGRLAEQAIRTDKAGIAIDWSVLREAPVGLQRRVALEALGRAGAREPGFEQARMLLEVARGERSRAQVPGGIELRRQGDCVVAGTSETTPACDFAYELDVPGSVWIPEAGRMLEARCADRQAPEVAGCLTSRAGDTVVVGADRLSCGLVVRSWRPGDALRPLGLGGRKKVQDLFVDRKVPRTARRLLPLVVDAEGRIVWVPGHAVDEAYRVTSATRAVVVLSMSAPGGRK